MAVLALGFVGTAIGGSIGGTILGVTAASIGGFLGSTLGSYIDNLLFPQKQEGPRLDDLNVMVSTYGTPIPRLYGPLCRLAPNVIWSTKLKETVKKSGGKGGPSVQITEYTYSLSCALLLGAGELRGIRKIWANGKVIFEDTDPTPSGTYSKGSKGAIWRTIRFYPGSSTQLPDPTIESFVGVGQTPAYRGSSYLVIEDIQLADFGNRMPNFEVLVEAHDQISVGTVCQGLVQACGLDPNTVSVRASQLVSGYILGRAASGVGALQPLALAYNFDVAEAAGGLRLQDRGQPPCAAIPRYELAGHDQSEPRPDEMTWERGMETGLPRSAAVTYSDPERDFQKGTQLATRVAGSADNNLTNDLPVVLSADQAREIADRLLWEAWTARETAKARTDQRHIHIEPGRVYVFETPAGWEPLRVVRKSRGWNGVIDLDLRRDRAEVYESTSRGASSPVPPNELELPGPTELQLLDIPILQDSDDSTGFYFAVLGEEPGWRGANLLRSTDGVTFAAVAAVGAESIIGSASTLAAGPTDLVDMGNVLTVSLIDTTQMLESVDALDFYAGANAAYVGPASGQGGEIVQFQTAVEVTPGVWELTGLLRGRLGTEHAVGTHGPGEVFVLLEAGAIQRQDFGASDWNRARDYKGVSLLEDDTAVASESFTNTGEGKRPLSPVHVVPAHSGSDISLSWVRRSRYRQPGLGGGPLPLGEEVEAYEVDIYKGATLKRTVATSSPSLLYLAADITADGFVGGDTVSFRVYQMSGARGRGHEALGSITV